MTRGDLDEGEWEVLLAAAAGEAVVDTATRLGWHRATVARCRARILEKLDSTTMAAAVAAAYHQGLLVAPRRSSS